MEYFLCFVLFLILVGLVFRLFGQWVQYELQKKVGRLVQPCNGGGKIFRSGEAQTWPLAQRKPTSPSHKRTPPLPSRKRILCHSRRRPVQKKNLAQLMVQKNPSSSYFNDNDSSSTNRIIGSPSSSSANRIIGSHNSSWTKTDNVLGRGSHGAVYEGMSDDGFFFAVKEASLPEQGSQGKQSFYELKQEITLLSQFNHGNIVQYYDTYQDKSNLYMFLELATKGSLLMVYKEYPLRESQVSFYTMQILHGLKYLHDRKVVHRDIKCENILMYPCGSVKLADFGRAKVTNSNTVESLTGTPFWMAPEIYNKRNHGLPADIWSIGCTVLEMLTRKLPYFDCDPVKLSMRIRKGQPPTIPESLSKDAKDFILQCLKFKPNDRPTAAQLLDHPFVKKSLRTSSGSTSPHIGRQC